MATALPITNLFGREQLTVGHRWLVQRDLDDVARMDQDGFGQAAWGRHDYEKVLALRNAIGYVAERGDTVVGAMAYELHSGMIELLRLVVHPRYRRRSVGRQMLDKLKSKLSNHRRQRIVCHVSERNVGACYWLSANGFAAVRVSRKHFGGVDDGIFFEHWHHDDTDELPDAIICEGR